MTKPTHVSTPAVVVRTAANGTIYMRDTRRLPSGAAHLTERLDLWAARASDRPFLAERAADGRWTSVAYGEARARVRRLAQGLLARGLSQDRPFLILSGNSIDHALLALAAMYAGVLYAPVSPAYSMARDHGRLREIVRLVQPGLVFADDGTAYARAIQATLDPDVEVVTSTPASSALRSTPLADLEAAPAADVDRAHAAVGPDTIAKILFTSGSTGHPKGVINTQRMLCANQEMLRAVFGFLADAPPTLCDWLPWHHTAGGNHNFGIVLYNGGTFYLDGGRPTPDGIETTVRNLTEIAATAHFTVPRTYEALLPYLRRDSNLRERFFSRLEIFFYAAAGLNQRYFDELQALAVETTGEERLWVTGLGATETAPFAMCTGNVGAFAGFIGFPVPGVELKLARVGGKFEARVRGPNVTPGYFRDAARTAAAFDEEGFYGMGDAVRLRGPQDPSKGLLFDGRLAEDFKLSSGTWVSVGPLRARLLLHMAPYLQDVVIAAPDRGYLAALLFPQLGACRTLCPDVPGDATASHVLSHAQVRQTFRRLLEEVAREAEGGSTRIVRAILVDTPPSLETGEVTDKGTLNQKAVLASRATLVDALYADPAPDAALVVPSDRG